MVSVGRARIPRRRDEDGVPDAHHLKHQVSSCGGETGGTNGVGGSGPREWLKVAPGMGGTTPSPNLRTPPRDDVGHK